MNKPIRDKSNRQRRCASILLRFGEDEQPTTYFLQSADLGQQRRLERLARLLFEVASECLRCEEQAAA